MRRSAILAALAAALLVTGCAADAPPESTIQAPEPTAPSTDPVGDGPEEAFLTWLEASRAPEPEQACGLLTEELQGRMLAEFASNYGDGPGTCEELTEMTAEMYAATGASAEVSIEVVTKNVENAVLFVTYADSGSCGTVALEHRGTGWIITHDSEGCNRP